MAAGGLVRATPPLWNLTSTLVLVARQGTVRSSATRWRATSSDNVRLLSRYFFNYSTHSPSAHYNSASMAVDAEPAVPSTAIADVEMPVAEVRWVHTGTKQLALPTTPITGIDAAYQAFSLDESKRIEAAWQGLPEEKRAEIASMWGIGDGEWSRDKANRVKKKKEAEKTKDKRKSIVTSASDTESPSGDEEAKELRELYKSIAEKAQSDPARLDNIKGVPVSQDSLFEVDLETLSLHPVFWPQSGTRVPVLRGTWFMGDETKPCTWDLAEQLEKGYQEIKPWLSAYQDELATARAGGSATEEKLKFRLPERFGHGLGVIYEDDTKCRVIASGTFNFLSRAIWSSLGTKPGGTYVYRGYTAALASKVPPSNTASRRGSNASAAPTGAKSRTSIDLDSRENEKVEKKQKAKKGTDNESASEKLAGVKDEVDNRKKALEEQDAPVIHAHNDEQPCTDLILVVHGIGQHLAAKYESVNFVYATNHLRQVMRKQSQDPSIASVMRNRRCQVLPVQWRANLKMDSEDAKEDWDNEKDNVFTISDITIGKSIPYVREVTNAVLLDIPLFMSHHREKMIEAVCSQANNLYRMWIARNPEFEKNGRVHIVGHSLGSALAAHILSNQPTTVPAISQLPKQAIEGTKDRFVFNTSNVYLAGSPLGVFLQLQQAHLIARAGRKRTMDSPSDEVALHPGQFGCMAADSVYNVFYFTDPIAYALNATVDVRVAKQRPPLAIPSVAGSMFPSVPLPSMPAMPSMPQMPQMPSMSEMAKYLPSYFGATPAGAKDESQPAKGEDGEAIEIEMTGGEKGPVGTRGERRFAALNPRGGIDFYLPSSSVNDYFDMITAHGNYWSDANFAAFLLSETFASESDLARTDVGVPESIPAK